MAKITSQLLEHNADAALAKDPDHPTVHDTIYPEGTIYSYAVGRPKALAAFKKRHQEISILVQATTTMSKDCALVVGQFIVPVETGFIDSIYYCDSTAVANALNTNKLKPEQINKALLAAVGLRAFTLDPAIKSSLNAIALILLNKENANIRATNQTQGFCPTLLQIAALSDQADLQEYHALLDAKNSTSASSVSSPSSADSIPHSLLRDIINNGGAIPCTKQERDIVAEFSQSSLVRTYATAGFPRRRGINSLTQLEDFFSSDNDE